MHILLSIIFTSEGFVVSTLIRQSQPLVGQDAYLYVLMKIHIYFTKMVPPPFELTTECCSKNNCKLKAAFSRNINTI